MKTLKDIEYKYGKYKEFYYLLKAAKENIKQIEREMDECEEIEREQYLFLAGKRHMYVEFFDIDGDNNE